ncbi:MAG: hypothetical protein JNK27_01285 [Chitinophagaceae bacterium]|nr:hypothetical protein [Chitinophagaceae bacterium]
MNRILTLLILIVTAQHLYAQDSVQITQQVSPNYIDAVAAKAKSLEEKLDKKSEKALEQMQKQEAKLRSKLEKIDSIAAKNVFAGGENKYKELAQKLKDNRLRQYIPQIDSLSTSLKFLEANPQFLSQAKEVKEKLKEAMSKMEALKGQLQKAEDIKQFLKERKQYLKEQLSKFGFAKELKKINKQVYYYAQQLNEYKEVLKDPKKAEQKALELLSKTKLFKDFMRKNSMLASLFRMPTDANEPSGQASLAGLQTRAQVNNLIQTQIAAGGPNAQVQFQQNLQAAQSQLNELKDKIVNAGRGSSNAEMPEGFKPNNQKTKSFLKRIELGTNIQSQKSTGFLPVTCDIGVSAGYKLNDKSIVGIGASYKMGWGRNIQHIRISHQGISARSFIDWKLKGSLWVSGGFEMNYRSEFRNFNVLQNYSAWQQSGLIGISKTVPVKSKFFKKTSLKLLWDFLSYQQVPRTQPVVFRIGYNIK